MSENSNEGNKGEEGEDLGLSLGNGLCIGMTNLIGDLAQRMAPVLPGVVIDEADSVAIGVSAANNPAPGLTTEQVRRALRETEEFMTLLFEGMAGAGVHREELTRLEDRRSVARIAGMAEKIRQRAVATLPELPLRPSVQVRPSPKAHTIIVKAKGKAEADELKRNKLIADTIRILSTIFGFRMNVANPAVAEKIEAFANRYASKSGLDMNVVVSVFSDSDPKNEFYLGVDKSLIESAFRDSRAEDLINDPRTSIFRSGVLPSKHFEQLLHGKVAALVMDLRKTWQSRWSGLSEGEFLSDLMKKAKAYIDATFKQEADAKFGSGISFLGRELSECASVAELQGYANRLPVDERSFDLLKKAHLFLKVMHIMLLHESEVNTASYVHNSRNLREEMVDFCMSLPNCRCYMNPPRDPDCKHIPNFEEDNFGMEVDRVEVAEGKPVYSTIDKIFRKDLYDTTEIGDFARMRIFLKKEDCYDGDGSFNEEKTEAAMEKVLGLMMARLGDDVDPNNLDYYVDTGKTNEASKGAHRGIHFNFKYKSSSYDNGITDEDGEPVTRSIDVEAQILAYMPRDEYEADHELYEKSRRALLFNKLGVENGFDNFVMDLISAVSNDKYDFGFRSVVDPFDDIRDVDEEVRKVYERQFGFGDEDLFPEDVDMEALMKEGWILFSADKLRLFVLLLTILTKKDSDGRLANARVLDYMQRYFPGKLHKLLDKYARILKGDEFKPGGEQAYLKRILEAKIRCVRVAISAKKALSARRASTRLFDADHSLKVWNIGKNAGGKKHRKSKVQPKLTLVTRFGNEDNEHVMELPYNGPIGLVGIPREGGKTIDFCWQLQDGTKSKPAYRIEYDEEKSIVNCYLLTDNQKLPMWVLQLSYPDGSDLKGRVFPCVYSIQKDRKTNVASITDSSIDSSMGRDVFVSRLENLSPMTGMPPRQARYLEFVKEAGRIWSQAKNHRISAGEYAIAV